MVRSPHGGPAILQAGTSPKGRVFAAHHADAIFAIQPNLAGAKAYYDDIKSDTLNARRRPQASKVLFGIQPILGGTAPPLHGRRRLPGEPWDLGPMFR